MHIDIETYSESDIKVSGACSYAAHPSTEILSLAYGIDLDIMWLWLPDAPPPQRLLQSIARGETIWAWYSAFEYWIWNNICYRQFGWPRLPRLQLMDSAALAYAWGLPGALKNAAIALNTDVKKDANGTRLINKFSKPTNGKRKYLSDYPVDASQMYSYNIDDVKSEYLITHKCPPLIPQEQEIWELDQTINERGVYIDRPAVGRLREFVALTRAEMNTELRSLTNGAVESAEKLNALSDWLAARGIQANALDKVSIVTILDAPLPPDVRRVLEIRQALGASSVAKLDAISARVSSDGRLRDLFAYHGAERTGRWAGRGPQPQNLPSNGPADNWDIGHIETVLTAKSHTDLKAAYPDVLRAIAGSLRGVFCAEPGHDLICSDYSAIEAVVLAELAGESWRQEVFRSHGKIYEMSASKITGVPFEEFEQYKIDNNCDHPYRKTIGKVAELASGYGGWIGAWKRFGADKHFNNDWEIKEKILAWRAASPAIVEFWGKQIPKCYGLEGACVQAIRYPGECFEWKGITYYVSNDVLYCVLPSGRRLSYHQPKLVPDTDRFTGQEIYAIHYKGSTYPGNKWGTNSLYGGKLTENVVQAVARDILAAAMLRLERAGYPVVMHIHDEIVSEVPAGFGSIEEFESLMSVMPDWAQGWPVKAHGGWRGQRYRKG